jgi:WD40 repeat protein
MTNQVDDIVMFPSPPPATDLCLDRPSTHENHPRRFLCIPPPLPGIDHSDVLVYGGNLGVIRTLRESREIPRCWDEDEDIRALAISQDGTHMALGLDSGSTLFVTYQKEVYSAKSKLHPFVTESSPPPVVTGPTFAAPVRDMQFHPRRSDWCAVATEEGFCVVHISDVITKQLEQEATQAHDGGGVRAIGFSPTGDLLASLGMDGRLCLWLLKNDTLQWKLLHRDATRCVTKRDTGEILGADAWDRSCRPLFLSEHVLVLPGETYLQFRRMTPNEDSIVVTEQTAETRGHVESLVTFVSLDNAANDPVHYFIAAGRDKRLTLWSLRIPSRTTGKSKVLCIVTFVPKFHSADLWLLLTRCFRYHRMIFLLPWTFK